MLKFLWIIIIAAAYILWTITAWKEFIKKFKQYYKNYTLQAILSESESFCIWGIINLFIIFAISLVAFVTYYGHTEVIY